MKELVIDYREKAIMEELKKKGISFTTQNLDIGDIWILCEHEKKICIERKTWDDLWSSIKDGRYREQRSRLCEWMNERHHVIYVIEGTPPQEENRSACHTSIHRLSLVYKIMVYRTSSPEKTVEYLQWLLSQNNLFQEMTPDEAQVQGLSKSIVKKKKDVQTPDRFLLALLQSVSGISNEMALSIMKEDHNITSFIDRCKTTKVDQLSNLLLTGKNGKTRKLGKEKARRIFYILGLSDEMVNKNDTQSPCNE